ncbi:GNAT family N-acetyltransferase (plasmid) [Priestia megaterium]|jgi:N-acetylglutamate synthase-like GNAT family acetyltransferase|uniref:GNAT family N-acetyltransferase n=1 Tax=Priestia TaxID=2800373 RepID=UPI000BF32C12|nr:MULTISPECIES: GNAT family N-acetyltransferase [Priestia]MDH2449225.1 GNAT family N-acetyltransferase [Priestia megaterium]MDL5148683.1 GNAT family N-acetyltransferase [Priestia megaterium]MDP9726783.1 N-acetylglutamate synthase-like GNAT family acetyltransferase [Priestia aryabhattai]MED3871225.1 GNAT family N-acetyltransferase [Priestia megaterium]PER66391.1 GNAT family N-acetyltransferase [Priestia megaterium]
MKEITSIRIDPAIKRLLSYATSEEKIDEEYNKYICSPNRKLYSGGVNGKIISCIGVEIHNSRDGIIKHIAVLPKERGSGMGSSMIRFICKEYNLNSISAETDKDAVLFYDNFGFRITSLGEKYPGVERFLCELDLK